MEKEQIKNNDENKTPSVKWNKSWGYAGPLNIPNELKNSSFVYGWVRYNDPGRLQSSLAQGWEIDKEVMKEYGKKYQLPSLDQGTPISGALCIGQLMLVRRKKEIDKEFKDWEQSQVIEPAKAAKKKLQEEVGGDVVRGEIKEHVFA